MRPSSLSSLSSATCRSPPRHSRHMHRGAKIEGGGVVCVFAFILLQHGWGGGLRQRASVLVRVILIGVLVRVVANDTP